MGEIRNTILNAVFIIGLIIVATGGGYIWGMLYDTKPLVDQMNDYLITHCTCTKEPKGINPFIPNITINDWRLNNVNN